MMPLDFTDEEWKRPNGYSEVRGDERWTWDSMSMGWLVQSADGSRRRVYPDHERLQADPAAAPLLALIRRRLSAPGKHLRLVKR